jgi:hypothetical protein
LAIAFGHETGDIEGHFRIALERYI